MHRIVVALSLALLLVPVAAAQDTIEEQRERFQLFNACRPMTLVVEYLSDYAKEIGLNREALQAAAESRLRAARLYTEDYVNTGLAHLYVDVHVVGQAFHISLEYKKWVTDEFGQSSAASTWDVGSTGTHGGTASYVVSGLSEHLDTFLAAYLRVNEQACGAPAPLPPSSR